MTVCIYRYIHATALHYWPNTMGMAHLKINDGKLNKEKKKIYFSSNLEFIRNNLPFLYVL